MHGFNALILGSPNGLNPRADIFKEESGSELENYSAARQYKGEHQAEPQRQQKAGSSLHANEQAKHKKSAYLTQWASNTMYSQHNFTQRFTNKRISKKIS